MRAVWIPALLVGLAFPVQAQSAPPAEYPYLLRVSRATPHLDTCVLLRRDGGYHFERDHDEATDVYEGDLSPEELSKLQQSLENEQLQKLTSEQIAMPLVVTSVENLQINIFRGDHWQNLVFPSSESQIPFRESLAPLLEWFNALRNAPHRVIPEDTGKSNCLTPRRIELRTRPTAKLQTPNPPPTAPAAANADAQKPQEGTAPSVSTPTSQLAEAAIAHAPSNAPAPQAGVVAPFLLRLEYTRFAQREADRTCAIVYASGRYHVERSSQEIGERVKAQVYEASLEPSKLQAMQQLLDDPELKALERGNIPDATMFSATDITTVWISREGKVQRLGFANDLRVQAAIGSHYVVNDKNMKLIRPLQKWVKTELPSDKSRLVKGALANQCAPK